LDPHNLALLYFIDRDLFRPAVGKGAPDSTVVQRELLLYLACLLNPVPVHPRLETDWQPSSSLVVQATPEEVLRGLEAFNARVIQIFLGRSVAFPQATCLPLSRKSIGGGDPAREVMARGCVSLFARTSGVSEATIRTVDSLVCKFFLCGD
jgi:hypothetical protein